VVPEEHVNLIEEALNESGNENHEVIEFNRLNYFFGKKVEDGVHRTRISVDDEVISAIHEWLDDTVISRPEPPVEITERADLLSSEGEAVVLPAEDSERPEDGRL
jgi:hypothetical protein